MRVSSLTRSAIGNSTSTDEETTCGASAAVVDGDTPTAGRCAAACVLGRSLTVSKGVVDGDILIKPEVEDEELGTLEGKCEGNFVKAEGDAEVSEDEFDKLNEEAGIRCSSPKGAACTELGRRLSAPNTSGC
eukprot:5978699-Amphidinium_carterae.1